MFCQMKFCMCNVYDRCSNETHLCVHPGRGNALVALAACCVLCWQDPLPGLSMECLPHCSWGLFLTAFSPSASAVPNWVSVEQLLYILVPVILPEMFRFPFVCHLNCFNFFGHEQVLCTCFWFACSLHETDLRSSIAPTCTTLLSAAVETVLYRHLIMHSLLFLRTTFPYVFVSRFLFRPYHPYLNG
jgi:hypothetical protein